MNNKFLRKTTAEFFPKVKKINKKEKKNYLRWHPFWVAYNWQLVEQGQELLWPFEHRPAGKPLGSQLHLSATKKEKKISDLGMTVHKYQKEKRESTIVVILQLLHTRRTTTRERKALLGLWREVYKGFTKTVMEQGF